MSNSLNITPAKAHFLPNGLKYIVHVDSSNPLVCLQLYIRIGSAWEADDQAGYSHFMEHITFKSTLNFGYNQITERVTDLGGSINAYTDFDCTCYYLLLPSEFLQEGLQILAELAIHPTYTAEDVRMEKDIIIEEIKQYENDPELDFFEYIQTTCFTSNPLRKPVLGNIRSVRNATWAKLKAFQQLYYQPGNAFLVLAGDLDPDLLSAQMQTWWGEWQPAPLPGAPDHSRFLEPEPPPLTSFHRSNTQEFLAWVLPELCEAHPQNDALLIASRYLATGRSSRLYKRLVEEEKLCSSVKVDSITGSLSGVSPIVVTPLNTMYLPLINQIFRHEYQALLNGEFDPPEFDLVKQDIINNWRYGFQGMENLANMLGAEEFIEGYEKLYDYDQKVLAVSMDEVLAAVRKYWQPANLIVYHQGPRKPNLAEPDPGLNPDCDNKYTFRKDTPTTVDFQPYQPMKVQSCPEELIQFAKGFYNCTLPNGLKFIYRHLPQQPVCGFALSTSVSQLSETRDQHGLNFLCSSALLHSTLQHKHSELMQASRLKGINIRVEQQLDSTIFRGKCFPADLETALSMLAEIISIPAFETGNISLIKSAAIDSLRRDATNPTSYAYQHWFRMLFGPRSPYDRYSGEISDIRRQTISAIRNWHAEHYHAGRFSLALVGAWEPARALDLVCNLFSGLPARENQPAPSPAAPVSSSVHKRLKRRDSGQAIINLGGFAPAATNQEHTTAFHLLAQILGGDMDSRLFNILREKYGYAYQTGMDFTLVNELGYWNAYAYCDPEDYKPCLKLMRQILSDACEQRINHQELLRAKNYLCGMYRLEQENTSFQAALLSNLSALGYAPEFYLQREERIRAVDLDTLHEVARNWLQPDDTYTHILL